MENFKSKHTSEVKRNQPFFGGKYNAILPDHIQIRLHEIQQTGFHEEDRQSH